MKKTIVLTAIAALSVFVSCKKDEPTSKTVSFKASISSPSEIKTSWASGDEIIISDGTDTGVYAAKTSGSTAEFAYKSGTEFTSTGTYTATYGSMPVAGEDQVYNAASSEMSVHMSASAVTATSVKDGVNFTFKADCGFLKLNLTASGKSIKRIYVSDGTNTYKLLCETAQSVDKAKDFYIALPAGTYKEYLLRDSDGNEVSKAASETATSITAGAISQVTFSDLAFSTPIYPENSTAGVKINNIWWAPVNCGYDSNHAFGLLYQWGRKYGQGYDGETPAVVTTNCSNSSAFTTHVDSDAANRNKFYYSSTFSNWYIGSDPNKLWDTTGGSSATHSPSKSVWDPCPMGWRVPTSSEIEALIANKSSWTSEGGIKGYWYSGRTAYSESAQRVFLPAAGYRGYKDGIVAVRGSYGHYWTSSVDSGKAIFMGMLSENSHMSSDARATGFNIRCVLEY